MKLSVLRSTTYALLKISNRLTAAAKTDPELVPLAKALQEVWSGFYKIEAKREWAKAEKDDRGEVLWTVFTPKKYERQVTTRTPNRFIVARHCRFTGPGGYQRVCSAGEDPWADLRKALDEKIYSPTGRAAQGAFAS